MRLPLLAAAVIMVTPSVASAATVTFGATVLNSCILTLSTTGVLAPSNDGTELAATSTTGVRAVLAVVSTGTSPTINFTAPTLTGPSASISGATKTLAYTSPGGAAQAATSGSYSYTATNKLLDTVTIEARVANPDGFVNGTYSLSSTATCQL